ncbi:MAG: O-antigen ligase family protein [Patescibacteria group bacterium]
MSSKTLLKIIIGLIFAVVVAVPLFYIKPSIYPFVFDKTLFFQSLVEVLFALWLALTISRIGLMGLIGRIRHISPIMLALAGFIAALLITSFTGIDQWRSFFSTYERAFGVFAIMHMAAFAVVLSSLWKEIPWRKVFAASIATSVVVGVLAIFEFYYSNNLLLDQPGGRAGSTFGNPSFLAGYLSWNIFLALYFLLARYGSFPRSSVIPAQAGIQTQSVPVIDRDRDRELDSRVKPENDRKSFLMRFLLSVPWLTFAILLQVFVLVFVTQTRGNILGLVVGVFVLLILFVIHPPTGGSRTYADQTPTNADKRQPITTNYDKLPSITARLFSSRLIYIVILVLVIGAGLGFWFTRGSAIWENIPGIERFRSVSLSSEGLQPRFIAARAAWTGFLERPIFGWGPENFNVVFNKNYDPKALRANYQETRFDKPHNFVLEDMATGGILLILARLAFFVAFISALWRLKDKLFGQITIAAFASYFVGNLFLFDTIGSTLLLFVLMGFVDGLNAEERGKRKEERTSLRATEGSAAIQNDIEIASPSARNDNSVPQSSFAIALGISFIFAYVFNLSTMRASYYHFHAFYDVARGIDTERSRLQKGIDEFKHALEIWHPYRWNFARDYAAVMAQTYFYNPQVIPKEAVLDAIGEMEKVAREHPDDAYNHYALVDMYNQISDINLARFLPAAEQEGAIALKLSPNRQQVYFSLAKTKTLEGDYPAAIGLAKYALSLDDRVADSHFYYGLLVLAHGNIEIGYAELKEAIRMGRKWKNFYEPLTIGNLLADAGRIEDATELYAVAVLMSEGAEQLEAKTKLGLAFYVAGKLKEAREELQYVADRFEFKSSETFGDLQPILDELGVAY